MASLLRRLLLQSRQCPSRIPCRAPPPHIARSISTTPRVFADETSSSKNPQPTDADLLAKLVSDFKSLDPSAIAEAERKGQRGHPFAPDINLTTDEHFEIAGPDKRKVASGFWAEGEEEMGADEDFYGDDITSLGHGELENHRMLREYNRLVAWELPLLSQLARPFTPPPHPFRFRYTSYLGESHPAVNKVVVQFDPRDLSLPAPSLSKLIKLSGPRYNPSTHIIKLSCEQFDTQAQNKRWLGETIKKMLDEAKDGKDLFEDVPFDFRHYKEKKRTEFPKSWVLTAERKKYLEEKRVQTARLEDERRENGRLVDGRMVIETSLPFVREGGEESVPVMVPGRR